MSIKTDATIIKNETTAGANTALRVGTLLEAIADDLVARQSEVDLNTAKISYTDAAQVSSNASAITTLQGEQTTQDAAIALNTAKVGVTVEEANPDVVPQAEAEAGVATTERIWTAQRVKQAIDALSGGSATVSDAVYSALWNGDLEGASKNALYDKIESIIAGVGTGATPETFTAVGGETTWVVTTAITSSHKFFVNGVKLVEGTDYTQTGSTFTFTGYTSVAGHEWEYFPDIAVPSNGLLSTDIDTLAELNALVTDATLIDTNDARLSDARTPTAHTHLKAEITDFNEADYATGAEGDLASSAVQPTDSVGTLSDVTISLPASGEALIHNGVAFVNRDIAKSDISDFVESDYATGAEGDLASTAVQPAAIANFETSTELNDRDTANRSRANHTGTQLASTISDFDTEVANNTAVALNTAKVGVTTEEANTINSEPIGSEAQVLQVVSITQAAYDLITPVATTFYIISG